MAVDWRQGLRIVYAAVASVIVSVIVAAVVWLSSVQFPSFAAAAALISAGVAFWCWRYGRTPVKRVVSVAAVLLAVVCGAAFATYYDGKAAAALEHARLERERREAEAKAEKARLAEEQRQEQIRREEEQRLELARRDKEMLDSLKKTNVDQYLAFLKTKDMALWIQEAKALRPQLYAAHLAEEKRQAEESRKRLEMLDQKARPLDFVTLDMAWSKGGFGSVMLATFTVKSTLAFPIRDIAVRCTISGNSGTELQDIRQTIYDVVPARSTRRFEVNMGFVHSQGARAGCRITDVQVAG